jgi:hypothetical protein
MTNRLAVAASRIASRLQAAASESVTYGNGTDTVAVLATIDSSEHEGGLTEAVIHVSESIDFLIPVADLILDGNPVKPQRQHEIIWGGDTYIVLPFGDHKVVWRYEDTFRVMFRIHTKLKEEGA